MEFRIGNLCNDRAKAVLMYRDNRDAYTAGAVTALGRRKQLDHVLELNVVRDAYDLIKPVGTGFQARNRALKQVLTTVANETENLNFTTRDINHIKTIGVQQFQHDYLHASGNVDLGLVHYLREATSTESEGQRLRRSVTAKIADEFVKSYNSIEDSLQHEDDLQGQIIDLLHTNMAAMRLF